MTESIIRYEKTGAIARLTLNRPKCGNAINLELPALLSRLVEKANLDPTVHVIALSGAGSGFCAGYDLRASAEQSMKDVGGSEQWPAGSPMDATVLRENHDPAGVWDPMVDYAMMRRNVRGFMSLFHSDKPVVCKVHGFCVAGGTDMALCSDLLVIEDEAKIGYPPARVWGTPTTAIWAHRIGPQRAKRLLFTGDSLSGREAVQWGLAIDCAPRAELDQRVETLLERIARVPVNQLMMMKLLVNQTLMNQGLDSSQLMGSIFDGISRHTREGYSFQQQAAQSGFKEAVRQRDEPFGDLGRSTYKG